MVVEQPRALEVGEHAVGVARGVEVALVGVDVELDPERRERLADLAEDLRLGGLAEQPVAGLVDERFAVPRAQARGELADVVALVAALRKHHGRPSDRLDPRVLLIGERLGRRRRGAAELLEVARLHRLAEHAHLAAAVVEVVLARDVVAGRLEQARDRVAEHGLASVSERERAGRVRRHELHLHALAAPLFDSP
jgi:hypothetical protein